MPDGTLYPSGNVSTMRVTGYADLFGVNPGNKIEFYVNCNGPEKYKVQIMKMIIQKIKSLQNHQVQIMKITAQNRVSKNCYIK